MRAPLLALVVLTACNGDSGIKVVNSPPNAKIISPVDGSETDEYTAVEFVANASDDFDSDEDLTVIWSSDIDGEFPGPFRVEAGQSLFETANLSPGNHTITILVVDSRNDSGQDSIQITVIDRPEAPAIQVVSPAGTESGIEDEPFDFVIRVEDVQDPPEALTLSFESDIDGVICTPTADAVGVAECEAVLSAGDHLLTFTAEDTSGERAEATAVFPVISRSETDDDGDGFTESQGDCDDTDGSVHPGADEYYNGRDDDCDGVVDDGTEGYDDDGDGYAEVDGDCNDASDITYPGAEEICDSLDNDCDTVIDEGTTCYDDDGDGWRETDGDCDDADATSYPGATELADGADNDCDGTVDEETVNYDDDGDGYAEISGDCDDTDPLVSPAGTEVCSDGLDNDCDGTTDEENATGCSTWYYDFDGDGYGSTTSKCLCASSGYYTSRYNTDCYDSNSDASPAATSWFSNNRGDGSFDYNCDGSATRRYTASGDCGAWPTCSVTNGWRSGTASCGSSAQWVSSCSTDVFFTCSQNRTNRTQECR